VVRRPAEGGRKDRRRPVAATVEFMGGNLGPYNQFQMPRPIFTADRAWVRAFVAELRGAGLVVPFKGVTLVNTWPTRTWSPTWPRWACGRWASASKR